jgi:hypothetical protein
MGDNSVSIGMVVLKNTVWFVGYCKTIALRYSVNEKA